MQDDYNRFIKRSIKQARCNYEDIFDDYGQNDADMGNMAGCCGVESAYAGQKGRGVESAYAGQKGCGVESAYAGQKGCGVESVYAEQKGCCEAAPARQDTCGNNKMCRPEGTLPVMVFIQPQTFGKMYNEAEGLKRGTLFPVLDKPFMGKGGHC